MNRVREVKKLFVAVIAMIVLSVLMILQPAQANELAAPGGVELLDLLAVFIGSEAAAKWLAVLGLVGYLFTHLRAWLPESWREKMPQWLTVLMEVLAGNYRRTRNATLPNDEAVRMAQAKTQLIEAKARAIDVESLKKVRDSS